MTPYLAAFAKKATARIIARSILFREYWRIQRIQVDQRHKERQSWSFISIFWMDLTVDSLRDVCRSHWTGSGFHETYLAIRTHRLELKGLSQVSNHFPNIGMGRLWLESVVLRKWSEDGGDDASCRCGHPFKDSLKSKRSPTASSNRDGRLHSEIAMSGPDRS
jgi:hypothetical protein